MYRGQATDDCAIGYLHMARKRGYVGHDDVIAQLAIMRNVRVGEEIIVGTNHRGVAIAGGTMDGNVFTDCIVTTNARPSSAARPLEILRTQADARVRINDVRLAEFSSAIDDDMRMQLATAPQSDMRTNHTVRSNFAFFADDGGGINYGGSMNVAHASSASMSMKVTNASLTVSPSTKHLPCALPILPRDLVSSTSMVSVSPGITGLRHLTFSAAIK